MGIDGLGFRALSEHGVVCHFLSSCVQDYGLKCRHLTQVLHCLERFSRLKMSTAEYSLHTAVPASILHIVDLLNVTRAKIAKFEGTHSARFTLRHRALFSIV